MDVLTAINGTMAPVGYIHISQVLSEYGEATVFEAVRNIVATVMENYPTATVIDYVKFYNEVFEMFCTISTGADLESFIKDYMIPLSDDDGCEVDGYSVSCLVIDNDDETAELNFLMEIYNLIRQDIQMGVVGLTAMFKNVLMRMHGRNAKPLAFVNDGFGKLCLKYQLEPQAITLT